jgi:hypothetical protein
MADPKLLEERARAAANECYPDAALLIEMADALRALVIEKALADDRLRDERARSFELESALAKVRAVAQDMREYDRHLPARMTVDEQIAEWATLLEP